MSQADELLATLSDDAAEIVTGNNIIIGTDRYIAVPESIKKIAVQYDHDVETITFDCPRYWDEHDLSVMNIYINYMRPDGVLGAYLCDNIVIDSDDETLMHFDWTISGHVTYAYGNLSFIVCIKQIDSNGNEITHWNSEICTDLYISTGMKCQETILRRYPDIISQLLLRMDNSEAIVTEAKEALAETEEARDEAEASKEAIENMTVSSEELTTGTPAEVVKTIVDDIVNLHFKLPAGAKGDTGNGIASVEHTSGDNSPGTTDVYTITMTDGTTVTFNVYNGADGAGSENAMQATTYDPNGKATDIYQYADDAAQTATDNAQENLESHTENTAVHITQYERVAWGAKAEAPDIVPAGGTLTGDITRTLVDNTIYTFTDVTSLSLTVPNVQCHIFLTTATDVTAAFTAADNLELKFNEDGFPVLEANSEYEISIWKGNILCIKVV